MRVELTKEQKKALLQTARFAIEERLFGKISGIYPDLSHRLFSEKCGLFVTLTKEGNLRGCIGYVEGVKPIRDAVREMACEAAFHDPRFHPLQREEFPFIEIEISILTPLEEVRDVRQIKVGRHGLVMQRGYHRGLLLPQVAIEYGWGREEFLNQTCRKAGMEPYCWENGAKVFSFEALVFGERDV
ncbi:MAG: AmmeMemoRadiSam system protein A [Brevinematales bacterium]